MQAFDLFNRCHIKTKFGGQILTTMGIDPNECIFTIAIGIVKVESLETWKQFLQTPKNDLGIEVEWNREGRLGSHL